MGKRVFIAANVLVGRNLDILVHALQIKSGRPLWRAAVFA